MTKAVIQNQNTRLCVVLILIGVVPATFLALYPLFLYILNPIIVSALFFSLIQAAYLYWIVASGIWVLLLLLILPLMMDPPPDEQVQFRNDKTVDLKEYRKSTNYGSVDDNDSLKDFKDLEDVKLESPDLVRECPQLVEQTVVTNRSSSGASTPLQKNWKLSNQDNYCTESINSTEENDHSKPTKDSYEQVQGDGSEKTQMEGEIQEKYIEQTPTENDVEDEDDFPPMKQLLRQKGTQNEIGPMRCSEVTPLKIDLPETKEVFECSLPTPSSAKIKNQVFIFIPEPQDSK